jgi:hypothetical protein
MTQSTENAQFLHGLGRQSGPPRNQQDEDAADERTTTGGADTEP